LPSVAILDHAAMKMFNLLGVKTLSKPSCRKKYDQGFVQKEKSNGLMHLMCIDGLYTPGNRRIPYTFLRNYSDSFAPEIRSDVRACAVQNLVLNPAE
jgi:hypothetical protein